MKIKISIIPFILFTIATVGLKLMGIFGLDGNGEFLGMNKMGITYAVIITTFILFAVCLIINFFDFKTASVYPVKKNYVAGGFAILSGVAVIVSSVFSFISVDQNSESRLMLLICALFSIPAGIALIMMSKVHFSGKSVVSGISALFIFPALWGCSELVSEFLVATKVSISASDMTPLFCYIFLTLYLFSHSMIVSRIKGKNPVKACFIYGLPAAAISLSFGIYTLINASVEGFVLTQILLGVEFILLSIYAVSFVVEMAFNSYTKDEIEVLDGLPDDEDTYEKSYVRAGSYDEIVMSDRSNDQDNDGVIDESYLSSMADDNGINDFVMGYDDNEEDDKPISLLPEDEMKEAMDSSLVFFDNKSEELIGLEKKSTDESKAEETAEDYVADVNLPVTEKKHGVAEQMSEIDRLLKELEDKK